MAQNILVTLSSINSLLSFQLAIGLFKTQVTAVVIFSLGLG